MVSKDKQWWPEFLDRFLLLGLALSLFFWLIETSFFGEGTFLARIFHPGSHELWMRAVVVAIILSFSLYAGRAVARLGRSRDEFMEQRNLAQKYLDVVDVMVVGLDAQGRVVLINRKGCEVLGYSEEEIMGSDWIEDFIPVRIQDEIKGVFERLMSGTGETIPYYENLVITRGGVERLVAWHNTVMKGARGEVGVSTLSSGVDITERRKAEVLLAERLDELERFRKATVERELRIKELKDRLDGFLKA